MFADDLKVAGDVAKSDDVTHVQSDLNAISEWSVAINCLLACPSVVHCTTARRTANTSTY
jgi:hypothetical protein